MLGPAAVGVDDQAADIRYSVDASGDAAEVLPPCITDLYLDEVVALSTDLGRPLSISDGSPRLTAL